MKRIGFILLPIILAGFMIPEEPNQSDGPYVLYKNGQVYVKAIIGKDSERRVKVDSMALAEKENLSIQVNTDKEGDRLTIPLQKNLEVQPAVYPMPEKLFVVSDIEGNFEALRKLLQANGVIDKDLNWSFGKGHLVLTGDFVDRGHQVTEVLWLIYSLEEKARAAGGYVHYILGNHEIMNMSGDLRYVQPKYLENAALMKESYTSLYGENSELGRWLRTKNVVETIGDILFTHGGISAQVNRLRLSPSAINDLSRPYYADSLYQYSDHRSDTLYSEQGPFWYRGYYNGSDSTINKTIDTTLQEFGVRHIATGHTIVADTISAWYGGRVFNTDVHHARGRSEALLVDNGKFYRVNSKGEKFLIH